MIAGVLTKRLQIKENLEILKKIGYDGFQFGLSDCRINTLEKRFLLDSETDKCIKRIKTISEDLKFPILAMHTFYPIDSKDEVVIQTFKKNLEYLELLNCKYLIIHISGYCDDKNRLKQAINCLNKVKDIYKKKGFEILLENDHKPSLFITIKDIESVISELKLNLCFDTTHAMQSDVDLDKFYSRFKKSIKVIHLSDFSKKGRHLEIGKGIVKNFKCFKDIINSNKLLILEVGKDLKKAESKEEIIEIYKNSFLQVNK